MSKKEQRRRYKDRHPEKVRAQKRRAYARKRALRPARVVLSPEERKARRRASYERWFLKNGGKHRIKRSPEEEREFRRESRRIEKHARKARKKANGGRMSRGLKSRLFEAQKGCCAFCHDPLAVSHLDHIMPLALGGSGNDHNYQLLCPSCNIKKGALHPVEYAQRIGLLL
mgnify:CR=1 FL=1